MSLALTDDFLPIVLNNTPLLDVRAPVEFLSGSFPTSTNIAILDGEQRRLVGICYKNHGNAEAIQLGTKLVGGDVKEKRLQEWKAYIKENPKALLYCFRGGQRSGITQRWLEEEGVSITRLKGGYKKFRNFLTETSQNIMAKTDTIIIGGRTGSGKTILLNKLTNVVDLEGLAKHRGSSFGKFIDEQPSQIDFEDSLYYKIIQHNEKGYKDLIIEHESHNIGRVHIPKPIFENFGKGSLVILHTPLQERIDITYAEYVSEAILEYINAFGENGKRLWFENIDAGFDRIKKRLGSERYLKIKSQLAQSFETDNGEGHKIWVESLLSEYYDPMYDYQLIKSKIPVIFEGNEQEVYDYLKK